MTIETDVCVIGSGPAGSIAAFELARRGREVIVLERGDYHAAADAIVGIPPVAPAQWGGRADVAGRVEPVMPALVGGAGELYGGASHRFLPEDFRMLTERGEVPDAGVTDWPIRYEDLEPYYARVEQIVGIAGTADGARHPPPRSTPYPLPPLDSRGPAVDRFDAAARARGLHPHPTPLAILSRPREGRDACAACGYCVGFVCRYGAKSSPTATVLRDAIATGRCRIAPRVAAHRLVMQEERAVAVEFFDAAGGRGRIAATTFVIAAGAAFTPHVLRMSVSDRFPHGVGNHAGLLGRYFASHLTPMTVGVFAEQIHPPTTHYVARSIDDDYFLPSPLWKGGVIQLHLSGGPLARVPGRQVTLYACGDALPRFDSRVTVSRRLDRFGVPLPKIEVTPHALDLAAARHATARSRELLAAMGAAQIIDDTTWMHRWGAGYHFSGSCRAGRDPSASVVDADGRVHDTSNVFVCDASWFPTSGGMNPALTVQANALRIAAGIGGE